MKTENWNPDETIDRTVEEIREQQLDEATVGQVAKRVWARLAEESSTPSLPVRVEAPVTAGRIDSCEDLQALIPSYLESDLPEARRLLLEDHLRECVPCRRALRIVRDGKKKPLDKPLSQHWPWGKIAAAGIAAVFVLGVALTGSGYFDQFLPAPSGARAVVEAIDGTLFKVSADQATPIVVGTELTEGDEIRTSRGGWAVLRLRDGSRVEVSERSELRLFESRAARTIDLARGNIIVEAAPQHDGRLMVKTDDCLVSVKGTVFSVVHGTKGSRVSVIEGEVAVAQGNERLSLLPGQQWSAHRSLGRVPVEEEIAWSRNAELHRAVLHELAALQLEIEKTFRPEVRTSSQLLDLMPEGTQVYVSLPNLSGSFEEAYLVFLEKLATSPELQAWWSDHSTEIQPHLEEVLTRVKAFGDRLGNEVVIGLVDTDPTNSGGEEVVLLAEALDEPGLISLLSQTGEELEREAGRQFLFLAQDHDFSQPAGDRFFALVENGVFMGSPSGEMIRRTDAVLETGAGSFVGSEFHQRIAQAYEEGTGYLLAVDLANLLTQAVSSPNGAADERIFFEALGFSDLRTLIVEQEPSGEGTETRAVLEFGEATHGIASWLAEPAPFGALDFVSPDATVVAAFAVDDPLRMVQELFAVLQQSDPEAWQQLLDFQAAKGISIENDIAAPLGGEFVFALDGPVLPTPSWKLVAEVYDPARLQQSIEWALSEVNLKRFESGLAPIELTVQMDGGHTFYSVVTPEGPGVHYLYVEGFLVAAPSRALLINALQFRATDYKLLSSSAFQELLPEGDEANFSAVFYQNVSSWMEPLAGVITPSLGELPEETRQQLDQMVSEIKPSLVYFYAGDRRITAASTGSSLPGFSVSSLLGFGGMFEDLSRKMEESSGKVRPN